MALPQVNMNQTYTCNNNNINLNGNSQTAAPQTRAVIERGASWSLKETRILLSLWGQDMVQRQLTNSKRTRHVWEKIADRIRDHGFERTADQVRTRVFNMIAEYRRILKNPTPERKKKCIFFDALNKIYQAKDTNGVKAALNNYEEDYNLDPIDFTANDISNDDGVDNIDGENSGMENEEVFAYAMSPSQMLNGEMNGNNIDEDSFDGPIHITPEESYHAPTKRLRSDSNPSFQPAQNQQIPQQPTQPQPTHYETSFSSFDNSSAALLIDRMFTHLAKETDLMREWINLEKERYTREISRRKEDNDREEKRERCFLQALMKMQEQTFALLSRQQLWAATPCTYSSNGRKHFNHHNNAEMSQSDQTLTSSTTHPVNE